MLWPLALFAPVLVYIMQSDLRHMRIPNAASLAGLAIFAVTLPLIGVDEALLRGIAAAAVFAIGFALFVMRVLAGGDVKILAVLMLFIPTGSLSLFGVIFSGSMLLATVSVMALRATPLASGSRWVGLRAKGHLPMGIAIGMAGLVHLGVLAAM